MSLPPPSSTLFPYTTLFRSDRNTVAADHRPLQPAAHGRDALHGGEYIVPLAAGCQHEAGGGEHVRRLIRADQRQSEAIGRSEEHTSELQSHSDLVCRLLLEK